MITNALALTYTDFCPVAIDCHDADEAVRRLTLPGLTTWDGEAFHRAEGVQGDGPVSARLAGWSAEDEALIVAEVTGA